jgi:hypothetical protein
LTLHVFISIGANAAVCEVELQQIVPPTHSPPELAFTLIAFFHYSDVEAIGVLPGHVSYLVERFCCGAFLLYVLR